MAGPEGSRADEAVLAQLVADLGPEHTRQVCSLFAGDARSRAAVVRSAFDAGDADGVARAAHRLASASGFLGAGALAATCAEIERRARAGQLGEIRAHVDRLDSEVDEASAELALLVDRLAAE